MLDYSMRRQLMDQYRNYAKSIGGVRMLEQAAEDLKIIDMDAYMDFGISQYKMVDGEFQDLGPFIKLTPRHVAGIRFMIEGGDLSVGVVDTSMTLSEAARVLLPKIGHLDKSYDEDNNKILLTGSYRGVRIILEDTPPETCTVEKVEEEVEVPEKVIAAHTKKRTRFKLVGDCEPLMKSEKISLDNPVVGDV